MEDTKSSTSFNQTILGELKPPEKIIPFRKFDAINAKGKLQDVIQHSWWQFNKKEHKNAIIESQHQVANFAQNYCKFLNESSINLVHFIEHTTITEQHVMRELLWMFHTPQECSIFTATQNHQLRVRENVTIPSCSVVSDKERMAFLVW